MSDLIRYFRSFLFILIRYTGIPLLMRGVCQRDKVTIIIYHDIDSENFNRHLKFLSRKYSLISMKEFIQAMKTGDYSKIPKKAMIITFDDGHKGNYKLLPVIKIWKAPVTIFLSVGLIQSRRHYWFNEVSNKKELKPLMKMIDLHRLKILENSYGFHDEREYDDRQSLSLLEIEEMNSFVDFQSHAMTHACLPRCSDEKSMREIAGSRKKLETILNRQVDGISFPNGDYSEREIKYVKDQEYSYALTTDIGYNTAISDPYRLKRLSASDSPTLSELIVKVCGLWWFLKRPYVLFKIKEKDRLKK